MDIDDHWLDNNELDRTSTQEPSTTWGKELMREAWPKRYPGLLSSDTYRGSGLLTSVRPC
jgi:hypothetical protein